MALTYMDRCKALLGWALRKSCQPVTIMKVRLLLL